MKPKSKTAKKADRKIPKVLNFTLYTYVEPVNGKYAKVQGKKKFGSFSAYVNQLIAKDRGAKTFHKSVKAA